MAGSEEASCQAAKFLTDSKSGKKWGIWKEGIQSESARINLVTWETFFL